MSSYDYIVVGGGSSGCIAAAELAAHNNVLLLEGGDTAEHNPETLSADGYKKAFINEALMWERFSEPQIGLGGKRVFMGSGRGLGGSGSINGMVYTRGSVEDYEAWPTGWKWKDIAPDFERLESRLHVHRRSATRFTETCIDAAECAGMSRKEDLNDGDLKAVLGYEWMNYEGTNRRSSYVAFLQDHPPANLTTITHARAHRIVFDADRRATGVEYQDASGLRTAHCTREVLLAAGALESPKLLMLSGVGPQVALRGLGIPVVYDAPSVGRNFHDHPNVTVFFRGHETVDCNYPQLYGFDSMGVRTDLRGNQSDTCFVFYPARSSLREGMLRLLPGMVLPPSVYAMPRVKRGVRKGVELAFGTSALKKFVEKVYGIVVILGKPTSRGRLRLRSRNPEAPAILDPAYFQDPADMDTMIAGVRQARRIANSPPLAQWGNTELMPGRRSWSDSAIRRFIQRNAMTTFHYAGTCAMGERSHHVVDTDLRVRGVKRVRVIDASAIPETPVSALNAPSMLIGYRAAGLILERRS